MLLELTLDLRVLPGRNWAVDLGSGATSGTCCVFRCRLVVGDRILFFVDDACHASVHLIELLALLFT